MSGILAVLEQAGGSLHKISLETLVAAQQIGSALGKPVYAVVLGADAAKAASALAAYQIETVHTLDHALLADYTPDGYVLALRQLIAAHSPSHVLFPHTYQVRDFAPALATSFDRVLVSDVVGHRAENGTLTLVRQMFQGKLAADVELKSDAPNFASIQAGSYRADALAAGTAKAEPFNVTLEAAQIRTKPLERFRESARAVDLTAAPIIVSVGRGIREEDNIHVVQELATALGAELAASRPICDNGWLPMERQVGSSGQTVAPKMYVAVGISGAIQHLVGMKGSKVIVAINKDPEAPIFEVADYGIVGDLFQVVPALIAELKK
ncbi:MAG: electron transfer flavoprotein alpha subunit [Bryobacterales bacterium]|nr:electron transfer flavoprotein alpha subunit [Bryobacterales bacterium]